MSHSARILLLFAAIALALPACQREEGPGEKAGRAVDEAMRDAGKAFEEAGEEVDEAMREAREELEKE